MLIDIQASLNVSSKTGKLAVLILLLVLMLLGSQSVILQHNHDGDLSRHADCSVCIKQGSDSDFISPTISLFTGEKYSWPSSAPIQNSPVSPLYAFHSRGPPI